jgi:hypothetical protein
MQAINEKIAVLTRWLAENASDCESAQKHLDQGTAEQAYWHYGYLCALRDVIAAINTGSGE